MKYKVVILGPNNQSCLGLIRCLGRTQKYKIEYIHYHAGPRLAHHSRYLSKSIWVNTKEDGIDYLLNHYFDEPVKPLLFGSNDFAAGLIDLHLDELQKRFFVPNAGEQGNVVYLMDKYNISQIAHKYGFNIPETVQLHKNESLPEGLSFPLFTKSNKTMEGGKPDECICNNYEELKAFQKRARATDFLAMEYIHKKYELNYYGFATRENVYIPYKYQKYRFSTIGYGGYPLFSVCVNDEMAKKVALMIKDAGYRGLFAAEFIVDHNDNPYFMEINFRYDGDTSLLLPGMNAPALYCQSVLEGTDENLDLSTQKDSFVGMNEILDYQQAVIGKQIPLLKWIWQFLTADSHLLFDWRDPLPVFFYYVLSNGYIKSLMKNIIKAKQKIKVGLFRYNILKHE